MIRFLLRWTVRLVFGLPVAFVALTVAAVLTVRFVDPPFTWTMVERARAHEAKHGKPAWPAHTWRSLDELGRWPAKAAVSGEDGWFWQHHGFDPEAISEALDANEKGGRVRGASTISQQVARNVFLWQERTWVRKGLETWFTVWLELLVPKERILELYLNVAETGPMVFGFEAGARHWYGVPASELTFDQAARIVAILPSPQRWNPAARDEKAALITSRPVPFPGEPGFGQMEQRAGDRFGWDALLAVARRELAE